MVTLDDSSRVLDLSRAEQAEWLRRLCGVLAERMGETLRDKLVAEFEQRCAFVLRGQGVEPDPGRVHARAVEQAFAHLVCRWRVARARFARVEACGDAA